MRNLSSISTSLGQVVVRREGFSDHRHFHDKTKLLLFLIYLKITIFPRNHY